MVRLSPCKINLLLNVLGRRPDGFHELETILQPVALHDELEFARGPRGIEFHCDHPGVPADASNLIHRAAIAFFKAAAITDGISVRLKKMIPMAAGLGGGSGNAATTLLALNDLFERPLEFASLEQIAAGLGSDVPFFLHSTPALATGRGERLEPLPPFAALRETTLLLLRPPFGISTPWAYQQLRNFPEALNGQAGRARRLAALLQGDSLEQAAPHFYNSLEAPAFHKYPLLKILTDYLRDAGAFASLMSGSGSAVFALLRAEASAQQLAEQVRCRFGGDFWIAIV